MQKGPCGINYEPPQGRGGELFVLRGAVIPAWRDRDYVAQYDEKEIMLDVYPCGGSSYVFREDDGLTLDYMRQSSCRTLITCSEGAEETVITIGAREGDYAGKPEERTWKVCVHGAKTPARVVCRESGCKAVCEEVR